MQHTDGAKHSLEWFNDFKNYEVIEVTPENFNRQKQKGLFKYNYAEIDPDADFIYFRYYSDSGQLLALETIPLIKDGVRGGRGGQYWGTTKPLDPVDGDSYLDILTMYLYDYKGGAWEPVDYTDADRYNVAMADIIAHAESSGGALELANAWVSKLVAGTILANSIFSKTLKVTQSLRAGERYDENGDVINADASGAFMGANGILKVFNAEINGRLNSTDGTFSGDIITRPLEVINNDNTTTTIITNSLNSYNFYTNEDWELNKWYVVSGTIDGKAIKTFKKSISLNLINKRTTGYYWSFDRTQRYPEKTYYKKFNYGIANYKVIISYTDESGTEYNIEGLIGVKWGELTDEEKVTGYSEEDKRYTNYRTIYDDYNTFTNSFNVTRVSNYASLRVKEIPSEEEITSATQKGTLYTDKNGFIKIKMT